MSSCVRIDFFCDYQPPLYESRGYQKYPIWVGLDLFSDIPKMTADGSCMYTISCKAFYASLDRDFHLIVGGSVQMTDRLQMVD